MIPSRLGDFRDRIGHQLAFDDAFPTFHIRRHFRAAACFVNGVAWWHLIFSAHVLGCYVFSSTIIVVMLASPLGYGERRVSRIDGVGEGGKYC